MKPVPDSAPVLVAVTRAELAEFGWDHASQARVAEFARPLLDCGHYDRPVHVRSSQWDFPHETHRCPTCGTTAQWDPELRRAIRAAWTAEADLMESFTSEHERNPDGSVG
jgi:hypothetical protein